MALDLEKYGPMITAGVAVVGASMLLLGFLRRRRSNSLRALDGDLTGKTAIVTGANTGIGFWTAKALAARHARVILACRSVQRGEEARRQIVDATGNNDVSVRQVDVSDFSSVRQFAEGILKTEDRLDLLVNNAGVYTGALPESETVSEGGLNMTLTINHLGPYLLTRLLIGLLRRSAPSRIVNLSSKSQTMVRGSFDLEALQGRRPLSPFQAYSHSKLANLLFTRYLAQCLQGSGVTAYCVDPGVVATEIWRNLPWYQNILVKMFFFFRMTTSEVGAETTVYTCVAKAEELRSGGYYIQCRLADGQANPLADDASLVAQLWNISAQLTGLPIVDDILPTPEGATKS